MPNNQEHECDLFLMSSHISYLANRSLRDFAVLGNSNLDGWGIGNYSNGVANVVRSYLPAVEAQSPSREFKVAMEAISSPIILGHLRRTSRGANITENNHPFKLRFLDYDWMFVHNGTARQEKLLSDSENRYLPEANSDSARVFEFLRKNIVEGMLSSYKHSLILSCKNSFEKLLNIDPLGKYNVILTNGHISFVFIHWRPFYMLNREKETGNVALISTIKLNNEEDWIEYKVLNNKRGKMIVFSGQTLIYNGDVE